MLARLAARPRLLTATGVSALGLGLDFALTPAKQLRSISSPSAASIGSVELYQYEICPFCNKLKALLDLHRVPYATTEVNPLTKGEIKSWSGGYRKVPITLLAGEQINDSPVIATALMDSMGRAGVLGEAELAAFRSPEALRWAEWSDKQFAVLLFPNITRSFSESYEAFGYVMDVPHFSMADKWANQLVGSFFMWMAQGKIKKKYAIDNEREAVVNGINKWMGEGVGAGPFAGGATPNFADVCVFGCLKAIDRTTAWSEIMAETSVAPWYGRMREAVEPGNACTSRQ